MFGSCNCPITANRPITTLKDKSLEHNTAAYALITSKEIVTVLIK